MLEPVASPRSNCTHRFSWTPIQAGVCIKCIGRRVLVSYKEYFNRDMESTHHIADRLRVNSTIESLLITTSLSRNLANLFRQLPDEQKYADYYEAIPEPEALDNVAVSKTSRQAIEETERFVVDPIERRVLLDGSRILQAAAPRFPQRKALLVVSIDVNGLQPILLFTDNEEESQIWIDACFFEVSPNLLSDASI